MNTYVNYLQTGDRVTGTHNNETFTGTVLDVKRQQYANPNFQVEVLLDNPKWITDNGTHTQTHTITVNVTINGDGTTNGHSIRHTN